MPGEPVNSPADAAGPPTFPETKPAPTIRNPEAGTLTERAGDVIGPYRLLELLGEGGFGVVWLAEQSHPVHRRVALKIIKAGMDSKAVIARFEAERQALAMMSHPNVARIFEAGTTPMSSAGGGRPYFAMEHVKGAPITAYCDLQRLTVEQRLRLFSVVCDAVQHAHMKGIIHRDLKPSNILVSVAESGEPRPVVIDFGVAKALAGRLSEQTIYTERGVLIGTPEYMSPEQAEMSETDIDTRADVYALGAILYELLTGALPFDPKTLRAAGYAAIQKIIREKDPPRPSTRLSTMGEESAAVAAARHVRLEELASTLRRELEWIPLKALRKDRVERYRSASEMADDVANYLAHRPLIAGPESPVYRVRKFVRRNRGAVAAGWAVVLALVAGLCTTLWQARRAAERANIAERARVRATTINEFVRRALQSSDPNQGGAQDTLVVDAMKKSLEELDAGVFRHDEETEADLRDTIASILMNNGRAAEAEPIAEAALATRRKLHTDGHPDVAQSLHTLARIRQWLGRAVEAEPLDAEALAMRQRLHRGDNPEVAESLNDLAWVRTLLGRAGEGEPLYLQALEMRRRLYPNDHPDLAASLNNVGFVKGMLGHETEAEGLFRQALEMRRRLYKSDHPDVAMSLMNVGWVSAIQGRWKDAEPYFDQALDMYQRLYKGNHPLVAQSLDNLAAALQALGRAKDAEPLNMRSLEMYRALNTGDHPDVARVLNDLASVRLDLGRAADAEALCRQALDMRERLFRGDHSDVTESLSNQALIQLSLGRATAAEALLRRALEMNRRLYPGDHSSIAANLSDLAAVLMAQGRTSEAREQADEAVAELRRLYPTGHPFLARALWRAAQARMAMGDPQGALAQIQESVSMAARLLPVEHPHLRAYQATLAECAAQLSKK